jgi:hypothetical protein
LLLSFSSLSSSSMTFSMMPRRAGSMLASSQRRAY